MTIYITLTTCLYIRVNGAKETGSERTVDPVWTVTPSRVTRQPTANIQEP